MYSCVTGAIGALSGPKHGGANEVALEIQERYDTPDEADADIRKRVASKEVIIGFGHPVYTVSDPRNQVIKEVARRLSAEAGDMKLFMIAERLEAVMAETKHLFPNLDWFSAVSYHMKNPRQQTASTTTAIVGISRSAGWAWATALTSAHTSTPVRISITRIIGIPGKAETVRSSIYLSLGHLSREYDIEKIWN